MNAILALKNNPFDIDEEYKSYLENKKNRLDTIVEEDLCTVSEYSR